MVAEGKKDDDCCLFFAFVFEIGSYKVAQAYLELYPLVLASQILGLQHHHAQLKTISENSNFAIPMVGKD
jgi:hypothetical protein